VVEVLTRGASPLEPVGRLRVVGVRRTLGGTWIVEDESAASGGIFLTWNAALRFIRREFGRDIRLVVQLQSVEEAA
jgi:hypothetical protein